jgi:hypothetical protein
MSLAAKKGWRLTITDDKGNIAQLVGVDESGFPMYVGTQSNVIAASTIGTNKLWTGGSSGLNLNGSSSQTERLSNYLHDSRNRMVDTVNFKPLSNFIGI